ncbi:hypothetical protein LLH03_13100 [bacterium]|nr:hypothetical protein [bacterium]
MPVRCVSLPLSGRTDSPVRGLATGVLLVALALSAVTACLAAPGQEKTEKLVLELRTETHSLPFRMPAIPNMPNMGNIPGMPPGGLAALMGAQPPSRVLDGSATYPHAAVAPIFVTVPADLGLKDNKLILEVPQAEEATPQVTRPGPAPQQPTGKMEVSSKLYWHPDTAKGPVVSETSVDLSKVRMPAPGKGGIPALQKVFDEMARTADGSESQFPEAAVGKGTYVLNTGGTAQLDGFLPPVKVTTPEFLPEVDVTKGIDVAWEPVAGARGYILHASEMVNAPNKMSAIRWVSTLNEPPERVQSGYEQDTSIADDLAKGILLPPETVKCRVPPDIFTGKGMFMLDVTAVGNDFYGTTGGIVVRGRIRSVWNATKMTGMPGMGGPGMGGFPGGPGMVPPPQDEEE